MRSKLWFNVLTKLAISSVYFCNLINVNSVFGVDVNKGVSTNLFTDCVPSNRGGNKPTCSITSSTPSRGGNWTYECVDDNVIRIIGEFDVLTLNCTAPYLLDLDYDGFRPTEAIQTSFSKTIEPQSNLSVKSCGLTVNIFSNEALFNLYNRSSKNSSILVYPRTGNFTIRGMHNKNLLSWFYFFFEEPGVPPSLMRNENIFASYDGTKEFVLIPCRPSHYNSSVIVVKTQDLNASPDSDSKEEGTLVVFSNRSSARVFDPTSGFKVNSELFNAAKNIAITCELLENPESASMVDQNSRAKTTYLKTFLNFTFPPTESPPQFGLEGIISYTPGVTNKDPFFNDQITDSKSKRRYVECSSTRELPRMLTILTELPTSMKLKREFVNPIYANLSYTVEMGRTRQKKCDEKGVCLRHSNLCRAILCQNSNSTIILEHCTQLQDFSRIQRPFGTDWLEIPLSRTSADSVLRMELKKQKNQSEVVIYSGQEVEFHCEVDYFTIVKPIVWFIKFSDGTVKEEFIDYMVHGHQDVFTEKTKYISYWSTKIMSTNVEEVVCAGSLLRSMDWLNVSMQVKIIGSQSPVILDVETNVKISGGAHPLICNASGIPMPEVYWERNGKMIQNGPVTTGTSIHYVSASDELMGTYRCVAKNPATLQTVFKDFSVSIDDDLTDEGSTILLAIALSSMALLVIVVIFTCVYIRHFRVSQSKLLRREIEEFRNGVASESHFLLSEGNKLTPAGALAIPYEKKYEIPRTQYEIDDRNILGSGEFGVVTRGVAKGRPVAAKTVRTDTDVVYLRSLLSELKIMIYLGSHENIVELVGSNTQDLKKGSVYVFVELCEKGSLETFLRTKRDKFVNTTKDLDSKHKAMNHRLTVKEYMNISPAEEYSTDLLLTWSAHIASGMTFLAKKNVIHGDLAARNILLTGDLTAKITDFGLSRQLYNYTTYVKQQKEPLPWRWLSLESLRDLTFSTQSDVWAYGVLLWEIFSLGSIPYPGLTWDLNFVDMLVAGTRMSKPEFASSELYAETMCKCWDANPENRPTFDELLRRFEDYLIEYGV